ncbi:DUF4292 domain-containing protein [Moheibacter lacus]|nr:DUF4292 domain-containing protein [Moheibacter lacus]
MVILFVVASCSTQKSVSAGSVEDLKTAGIIKTAMAQKPKFVHLTISSKINADIDDTSVGLNGKIYIQDGKKIWVNVSKFGINAARALITPDGFQAYEKLDRTYIDGDFSYFNNLLKVNFIDYEKLQNLLLGQIFVDMKAADFESEVVGNEYVLRYEKNEEILQNPKEGKYFQIYNFDSEFRLKNAYLKDPKSKMELNIAYADWQKVGTQFFPKTVKVLVKDKKTQKVDLEYNNFTFEESQTPFEIPSGYEPNKLLK